MLNKKQKKRIAVLAIIAIIAFLVYNNNEAGRSGFQDSNLNEWYDQNYTVIIFGGLVLIVLFIMWGFHEGRLAQQTKLAKETRKTYQAYEKIGGQR